MARRRNSKISSRPTAAPGNSRSPAVRLLQIHELLQANALPKTEALAAKFSVSVKTIRRDIDCMRLQWRLPVAYDFAKGGYRYTRRVDHFPGAPTVSASDVLGLMIAQKTIAQYDNAPFAKVLREARDRLIRQLSPEGRIRVEGLQTALAFRPLGIDEISTGAMETVLNAFQQRRVLTFDYRKPGERETTSRRLQPSFTLTLAGMWSAMTTFAKPPASS